MKLKYSLRGYWEELKLRCRVIRAASASPWTGDVTPVGRLYATKVTSAGREELGLICTKVVTDAAVAYLVLCFTGVNNITLFKYHASGTGVITELASNTALGTEVAARATGTQLVGASANIYRTVGTISYGATFAVTEHGIFSATSAGTMLDRSVFAAINVISGDSIEFTYELTLPSGS